MRPAIAPVVLTAVLVSVSPLIAEAQTEVPVEAGVETDQDLARLGAAVARLARKSRLLGLSHMRKKDYPAALRELTKVYDMIGDDPEVTHQLARLHTLLGDRARAESFYRETLALDENHGQASLALVELWLDHADTLDASRVSQLLPLLARAEQQLGNTFVIRRARARAEAVRGDYAAARGRYEALMSHPEADAVLALEVGDFHRDFARYEAALRVYRSVDRPPAMVRAAAQRIFELDVRREARALGFAADRQRVPEAVTQGLSRARMAAARGQYEAARAEVLAALQLAPTHAEARAELGTLLAAQGKAAEAELSFLRALALSSGSADYMVALADLYMAAAPPRDDEAHVYLTRAAAQRPDWAALYLRLARVERRLGKLPQALAHVRNYLRRLPEGAPAGEARALLAELEDSLVSEPAAADAMPPADSGDASARERTAAVVARARAHLQRGAADAALVVLARVPAAERSQDVVLLHARILQGSGRHAEAAAVVSGWLRQHPQAPVRLKLAELQERAGRPAEARAQLVEAERRGRPAATLALAKRDLAAGGPFSLLDAHRRASRLVADPGAVSLHGDARRVLRDARWGLAELGGIAAACILLPLLGFFGYRRVRHGGIDLATLVERHPEAGPEVQRIISAIRHEVLKHNTMMLTGLSESLSAGSDAGEHGQHLARAMFGDGEVEGAYDRLLTYADQLVQLGRAHGERVNLWHRDAMMSSLAAGMEALRRVSDDLPRVDGLGRRARRRVVQAVQEADEWLNREGYQQLRELLDQVRVLHVTEAVLHTVFERVRHEPGFSACEVDALQLQDDGVLPCTVDMPRAAFEDVLANLMRNALQASARRPEDDTSPIAIGVAVREEMDPVTALSRVLFMVRDRATEALEVEQLRGQYIEQGLGLTADLVARFQGSLDVSLEASPWTKAVVFALPLASEDEQEAT